MQDNHSRSSRGVLRGLHYQVQQPQWKLIRAVAGSIYDVAVDIRSGSPRYGRWFEIELSADVLYKTDYWAAPEHERTILWSDPALAIRWPLTGRPPILSATDQAWHLLEAAILGDRA